MKTSIQLLNPSRRAFLDGGHMNEYDHDLGYDYSAPPRRAPRRARRHNPSGKAAVAAGGHTAAKVLVGAIATFVGKKALGMKKADGTAYLSPKQQLLAQGVAAAAAAVGGALLDNAMLRDAADGTAIVMGGDAAMAALYQYRVEEQVRAAVGLPAPATTAALPAPAATAPGGYPRSAWNHAYPTA